MSIAAPDRLAWSNLAAQSAEQLALAAAPLVAVLVFGASAGGAGFLHSLQTLPYLLLALPLGLLADRMSRRDLLVGGEIIRGISLAAIVLLWAMDGLSLVALAVLGFVGTIGTIAFSIAAPALVPTLVPLAERARTNSRIELARTVAFVAGPALGGALVGWTGGESAFVLAAALSLVAAAVLFGLDVPVTDSHGPIKRDLRAELAAGIAFVARHALLRPILLTQIVFNGAFFILQAVFVPYAVEHLGMSAEAIGWTLATYGVGMLIGALGAPKIMARLPVGIVIVVGPICGFAASLAMVATILWPEPILTMLCFFLIGVGPILWVIATVTLRQAVTPGPLLGRVSSVFMLATGARPIGAALGALIGTSLGMEACMILAAILFAVQAGIILLSRAARLT